MTPAISIIVPAYNGSRYIQNMLATVLAQTISDWELIVVDDGSTDGTAGLLAQAPPDGRRHVIRQANLGLAAARNRGLAVAQGQYVAFLDVDDAWHPEYLSRMGAALDQAPEATAAFAGWQYMDEDGQLLPQTVLLSPRDIQGLEQDLMWRNSILPSSLVARRAAVAAVAGFDESLQACEDWDLWLRLRRQGPFVAVSRVLMWYRTHRESMTENVASIECQRLKVNAKHLGSLDAPLAEWPLARRQAVGYTYFNAALGYLRHKDEAAGRNKVRQAVQCWPGLLQRDEFYYELGCAFQPRGLRGTADGLDLKAGASVIRTIVFHDLPSVGLRPVEPHWGRACLVLARLAHVINNQPSSRAYALQAFVYATGRDRLTALRLLARSALPESWLRAIRGAPRSTLASRPT